jgi:glycosyltransferase 2 family protein
VPGRPPFPRVARAASLLRALGRHARAHPRLTVAAQLGLLTIFLGSVGWAIRGSFHSAGNDLRDANPALFVLACATVAAYYLVFVIGWMRILADWDIHITYPVSLRAEMVSMLAKYVPGGVWTPAARVVAMRRAGVADGALVTAAMLVEAGLSAVAGVAVFAISLVWVRGVSGPIAPLAAFAIVVAALLHPRVFRPLASRFLRRFGYRELPPLRMSTLLSLIVFYSGTWVIGGVALWLLLRSVGAHPSATTIVFLGGTAAVGAIVAVLAFFAPSGLGAREGSMYGLMLAVTSQGAALGATVLNRVAITVVEVLLLAVGGLVLRRGQNGRTSVRASTPPQPATSADMSRSGS